MDKVGRNDPCPCGSGKKYKNCHQQIDEKKGGMDKAFVIGALLLVFLIIGAFAIYQNWQSASSSTQPGPTPPGKVWSEEHGHWHNI